jgi:hypothetical protein
VFQVRIGGELLTYSQVSQIPDTFDNLIRFEPDFPEPPHTLADHAYMGAFPKVFAELMNRERKYVRS